MYPNTFNNTHKLTIVAIVILESEVYTKQYTHLFNDTAIHSTVPIYHHGIQDMFKKEPEEIFSEKSKRKYFSDVASQFRSSDILLYVDFNGEGVNHDGGGFSTDISDTCHWLTPFVKKPNDFFDLWYIQ